MSRTAIRRPDLLPVLVRSHVCVIPAFVSCAYETVSQHARRLLPGVLHGRGEPDLIFRPAVEDAGDAEPEAKSNKPQMQIDKGGPSSQHARYRKGMDSRSCRRFRIRVRPIAAARVPYAGT